MSGITAIARKGRSNFTRKGLERITHRGNGKPRIVETGYGSIGEVTANEIRLLKTMDRKRPVALDGSIYNWKQLAPDAESVQEALQFLYSKKGPLFVEALDGPFAFVLLTPDGPYAARSRFGACPLYTGISGGALCFASEVKALMSWAQNVREFPHGCYYDPKQGLVRYHALTAAEPLEITPEEAADTLLGHLTESVTKRIEASGGEIGSWLSGGLDSSALAALTARHVERLQTFAVGVEGAPDIEYARAVADYIGCEHRELIVDSDQMLEVLPEVIYHLESFDALLVRSSVTHFLVGKLASDYVQDALSGEGGDELFAGYEYLKRIEPDCLADELVEITDGLHNTALQRVDRCSQAHGLTPHTAFLDRDVVDFALRIPTDYKIYRSNETVEKWILRRSVRGLLPKSVVDRPKVKFWQGAGVVDLLGHHAEEAVSDSEFVDERSLPDGTRLNDKEELFYYRIFKDHFGDQDDLSFVGRTKRSSSDAVLV